MAVNRLMYDKCSVETEVTQNTSYFNALMDTNRYVHEQPCLPKIGLVGATSGVSTITAPPSPSGNIDLIRGDLVALENDLRGQTRPVTKCPRYDYLPRNGSVYSEELWKPVKHPEIKTDKPVHVPSCDFIR